jgi:site-specific recombinase XerD
LKLTEKEKNKKEGDDGMRVSLPKVLSRTDVNKLIAAIDTKKMTGLRNKVALYLLYRAGLRNSEVCDLSPKDIDWENGLVYIQQSKGKKDRYVPLDEYVLKLCKEWDAIRPDCEYFVCTSLGTKLSDRYLRTMCYDLSEKAGVYINDNHRRKPVHPHTFRHCFATELLEDGYSIKEVQELLGHASIETTMVYLSVRPEKLMKKMRGRAWAI